MKGCSVSILCVHYIAILCSLVTVGKGAVFTGITCHFPISDFSGFQAFVSSPSGLTGAWLGNKNVCFQEGLYNISSFATTYLMASQQTWYGPQYLADPTCGGSFSPTCARAVSGKALDPTKEAIILYQPSSPVSVNIFSTTESFMRFSMLGFSVYNTNSEYFLFEIGGPTTLTNNYCFTPDSNDPLSSAAATFGFLSSSFSLTNNWFDGSGTAGSTSVSIQIGGLVSNNYFSSNVGIFLHASSRTITVTGNIFLGSPDSTGIYSLSASLIIRNNTFIASDVGIDIEPSTTGTVVIDGNLFVFCYIDSSYDTAMINIGNTHQCNITNNVFAGPGGYAISGHNPYYLANNDFSQSALKLHDATWDVSAAHVSNNYFGPYGPYNIIDNNNTPVDNVVIPNTYVSTASSSIVPFTTTPHHPSLIAPPLITNIEWTLLSATNRPYFLVGDQTNVTWTFDVPSWYDTYGISSSYFTLLGTASLSLYGSANSLSDLGTSANNLGDNSFLYTPSSGDIQTLGGQYGYFMTVGSWGTTYSTTSAKSLFPQEPVSFSLNTLPINGYFYSDQGSITADIYTDLNIKNIIFSFKSTTSKYHHQFLFLSNGTGSTTTYTIPVSNVTRDSIWKLSANFTLVTGETFEIKDNHTFGYVVSANCNITAYLNKKYNTTARPNIKKYCPSTPYSKIAWSDSELSDNKGTVSLNQNSTYFIVTPYQNRSGIATWNYGIRLSNGHVSNFTATLIVTSANPSHNSWTNVTWNLESNQSINVTQNIGGLVSYSPFPVQITGLYAADNTADTANTQQVDAMSLYLKKQKAILVGQSDGTLTLHKANVNGNTVTAGAVIKNNFSSHWTFLVSLWAGDEDLDKTNDTASITIYVN